MPYRRLIILPLLTIATAACTGGGGKATPTAPATTPASTTAARPTAAPTRAPVPERPAVLKDYALVVAAYLSDDAAAASSSPCLAELYAAWKMPGLTAADSCLSGNTDGDPADEVAAVFAQSGDDSSAGISFGVTVFDRTPSGFRVAYESAIQPITTGAANTLDEILIAVGDVNADGIGELVYELPNCGAHTCFKNVYAVRGTAAGYVDLTPPSGISMEYPDLKFEDVDSDGKKEIVLYGGEIGSVGAGPQRKHTEVWAWDGAAYALRSKTFDSPTFLYHAVKDADALFAAANYAEAAEAYLAAVDDKALTSWKSAPDERSELESYALFRAGLAAIAGGGDRENAIAFFARANAYAGTLHHQLAGSFAAAYGAKSNISGACAEVRDDIRANLDEYNAFWDFGYGNPTFDADAVCPF
ncbi:MAG: hypothetical protein HY874_01735 [Chloroflexi bacterium]|nr:hypothetical protein [Chloroflexota bacterium]